MNRFQCYIFFQFLQISDKDRFDFFGWQYVRFCGGQGKILHKIWLSRRSSDKKQAPAVFKKRSILLFIGGNGRISGQVWHCRSLLLSRETSLHTLFRKRLRFYWYWGVLLTFPIVLYPYLQCGGLIDSIVNLLQNIMWNSQIFLHNIPNVILSKWDCRLERNLCSPK